MFVAGELDAGRVDQAGPKIGMTIVGKRRQKAKVSDEERRLNL